MYKIFHETLKSSLIRDDVFTMIKIYNKTNSAAIKKIDKKSILVHSELFRYGGTGHVTPSNHDDPV